MESSVIGASLLDIPLRVSRPILNFNGRTYHRGDLLSLDGPMEVNERQLKLMISQGRVQVATVASLEAQASGTSEHEPGDSTEHRKIKRNR